MCSGIADEEKRSLYLCAYKFATTIAPLYIIRTPLLPKNYVLFREVSFGERSITCIHGMCCQEIVSFVEGRPLFRVSFKHVKRRSTVPEFFGYILKEL